jgi:phosphonoacetaldehyde hydrolase
VECIDATCFSSSRRESVSLNSGERRGVRAVVFDVSGTVLDYGSRGPVAAFVEFFARHGVTVSPSEVRRSMGAHKKDHIWMIASEPEIAQRWKKANGKVPNKTDMAILYGEFIRLQAEMLRRYCDLIPGVLEVVAELRCRGIKIVNTTGFDRSMLVDLIPLAAKNGYSPDLWVCSDEVSNGRPAPWMAFHAAEHLNLYPMSTFVKVGDTLADVGEAHAAGMWAVSVIKTGNEIGLSPTELTALSPEEQKECIAAAQSRLAASGPHYLIESVANLMPVIDEITSRINRGERP